MRKNLLKLGAVASALLLGGYSIANAVPTLTISDGILADTITIVDQSGADQSSILGEVSWFGTIGGWTLNFDTGDTKPNSGSATVPDMSLSFAAKTPGTGTGQLTITWSDTGFGPSSGGFIASIGGTTTGSGISIGFSTSYNTTSLTTTGTTLNNVGASFGASNLAYVSPLSLGGDYSLTEVVTITASAARVYTSGNAYLVSVPDAGSTLILLGTTMSMLCVYSRSRSKQQKG